VAERHARYFTRLLNATFGGDIEPHRDSGARNSAEHLGNVRSALAWCFDTPSKVKLGVELAAASVPVFLELSLLSECHKWSKDALTSIDHATRGSKCELELQEALAIASTWMRGNGDEVRAALTRGLALATELGEASCRLRLLVGTHVFLMRIGDFRGSLPIAEHLQATAHNDADSSYEILSDWMRGSSEHFIGNQTAARDHFQKGFAQSWELRTALTLARVRAGQGNREQARQVLAPLYEQFTEGFETADLKAARELLLSLAEA